MFDYIIQLLLNDKTEEEVLKALDEHEEYSFFKPGGRELNPKHRTKFSSESKSEVFMRQGVENALRCNICGGYLHKNSIQIDHHHEIENGGIGNADNGRLVHPYCNSIKKELINTGFLQPAQQVK